MCRRVERTAQGGDHIGAGAPIAADGQADTRGAGFHVLRLAGDKTVGENVEREAAGRARGHRDVHGIAGFVVGLVERDFQKIRRVGVRLGIEAGIKAERRDRTVGLAGRHFESIAAPFHRQRHTRRLVGGDIHRAVGDTLGTLDRLVFPLAVLAVPLIAALDLQQLVMHTVLRQRLAVGRDHDHVEIGIGAVGERAAGECRFDAEHRASGVTGSVSLRSTARPPDSAMLTVICASSGRAAGRHLVERDGKARLAGGVGRRQVVELLADRRHLVVDQPEGIAGKPGSSLAAAIVTAPDRSRLEAGAP